MLVAVGQYCEQYDLRPYLGALLRNNCEADLVIVKADPGDLV